MSEPTLYDRMGGHATFHRLVEVFYDGVAQDATLRAMYPEADLEPAKRRFEMFLEQYWGGPTTYSAERGHPRLRMRHMPFAVTPEQRDRLARALHNLYGREVMTNVVVDPEVVVAALVLIALAVAVIVGLATL